MIVQVMSDYDEPFLTVIEDPKDFRAGWRTADIPTKLLNRLSILKSYAEVAQKQYDAAMFEVQALAGAQYEKQFASELREREADGTVCIGSQLDLDICIDRKDWCGHCAMWTGHDTICVPSKLYGYDTESVCLRCRERTGTHSEVLGSPTTKEFWDLVERRLEEAFR